MKPSVIFLLCYLIVFNLCGFISMGLDKRKARQGLYRISEKKLFLFAALGGAFGSLCGMYAFRHKTRHWYFKLGMPVLCLVWAFFLYLLFK